MTDPKPGRWAPCPPGELERLTSWLAFRRRLHTAALAAGVLLGTAGAAGAGWAIHSAITSTPPRETTPCWDETCPPAVAE